MEQGKHLVLHRVGSRHAPAVVVLCRPVESLGQVRRPLEHDLLGQLLGVAGVARHQLAQPLEPVVDGGLGQR